MSVQALSWVFEHSESRLGARHVLLSIANHAKSDGSGAWPSVQTIARESRLSEREVQYAFKELEVLGELERRMGAGKNGTTIYSLPKMRGAKFAPGGCKIEQEGVQNRAEIGVDFAPEPKSIEPSLEATAINPATNIEETKRQIQLRRDFNGKPKTNFERNAQITADACRRILTGT